MNPTFPWTMSRRENSKATILTMKHKRIEFKSFQNVFLIISHQSMSTGI